MKGNLLLNGRENISPSLLSSRVFIAALAATVWLKENQSWHETDNVGDRKIKRVETGMTLLGHFLKSL